MSFTIIRIYLKLHQRYDNLENTRNDDCIWVPTILIPSSPPDVLVKINPTIIPKSDLTHSDIVPLLLL